LKAAILDRHLRIGQGQKSSADKRGLGHDQAPFSDETVI
jgi:hypothetical protein